MERMMDARRIVERYFLGAGERVEEVSARGNTMVVETSSSNWRVDSFHETPGPGAGSFALYEVLPDVAADPPPRPHGVAVLPDSSVHMLNDQNAFVHFIASVGDEVEPRDRMALLARYQAGDSPHSVIWDAHSASFWLTGEQLQEIQGFTYPESILSQEGNEVLVFCTFCVQADSPLQQPRIDVYRWEVAGSDESISWSRRPIAQGIEK